MFAVTERQDPKVQRVRVAFWPMNLQSLRLHTQGYTGGYSGDYTGAYKRGYTGDDWGRLYWEGGDLTADAATPNYSTATDKRPSHMPSPETVAIFHSLMLTTPMDPAHLGHSSMPCLTSQQIAPAPWCQWAVDDSEKMSVQQPAPSLQLKILKALFKALPVVSLSNC